MAIKVARGAADRYAVDTQPSIRVPTTGAERLVPSVDRRRGASRTILARRKSCQIRR